MWSSDCEARSMAMKWQRVSTRPSDSSVADKRKRQQVSVAIVTVVAALYDRRARSIVTADCSFVWTSPVFVAFRQELFIWRGLTQTCYFVSESQRNLRRAVCVSPPLLNTVSWKPVTYPRNTRCSNGTAIRSSRLLLFFLYVLSVL